MKRLTIHIIISSKDNGGCRDQFFVVLDNVRHVRQFRRILAGQGNEKAIMFALSKGKVIDPVKANDSAHLILTKDGVYWDLLKQ